MKTLEDFKAAALNEMQLKGYQLSELITDDNFHRFGEKKCQWYVGHIFNSKVNNKPLLLVSYGDWRSGETLKFQSNGIDSCPEDRSYLKQQIQLQRNKSEQVRKEIQDEAALEYQKKWEQLSETGNSPYLEKKHISEHFGARFDKADVFIPCRNIDGDLRSLQKITAEGNKFFFPNGQTRECFHLIGNVEESEILLIVEGFATGASVHMATGECVIVAFNANNLICVAQAFNNKYPNKRLVICGDDDRWTKKPDGTPINPGFDKAKKASRQVRGTAIFPKFIEGSLIHKPTDFNDLHCLEGIETVAEQILDLIANPIEETKQKAPSQATLLLELCSEIELFHTSDTKAYATISVKGHFETWPLKSNGFKNWLLREYYLEYGSTACAQAVQDALGTLEGKAIFEGDSKQVFLRIAQFEDKIFIDLANENWEVIEISSNGWKISQGGNVKFLRSPMMRSLPMPLDIDSSGIEKLRKFINVSSENDFKMIIAWLLNAFNPLGPYIALVLYGEQGSAKSTTVRAIRALIDPSEAPLRREPRNSDDLMVSARANWVVAIDNMSYLPDWLSDDFCRLATGGGLSKRTHYSDDGETVLDAKRPLILNGIDEFVVRGDLSSRSIALNLPAISTKLRLREKIFWEEFEKDRPYILSSLCNALSNALKDQNNFELEEQLRMADAWHWISAAEPEFGWSRGSMIEAFKENQLNSNYVVLNSSIIYPFIQKLSEINWSGTPTNLFNEITSMKGSENERSMPKSPRSLTDRIRRISPALRATGIEISFGKTSGSNSERVITIRKL